MTVWAKKENILIVDGDPEVKQTISAYFAEHDVATLLASNATELERQIAINDPSLILLDVELGKESGIDLLRPIRARSNIPVIIMTSRYLAETIRIRALKLGADAYIAKPFSLRELLARVRAVQRLHWQRQIEQPTEPLSDQTKGCYRFGGWTLERSRSRRLFNPKGERVPLTRNEYALLLTFLAKPQSVISRGQLMQLTRRWGDIKERTIDSQILRLRRKLHTDPTRPEMIRTERHAGYVFGWSVTSL